MDVRFYLETFWLTELSLDHVSFPKQYRPYTYMKTITKV